MNRTQLAKYITGGYKGDLYQKYNMVALLLNELTDEQIKTVLKRFGKELVK